MSGQATTQQEQRQSRTFYQDQRSAVMTIAEREQKQDAQGITCLGKRRDHAHAFDAQMQV